jgi:hypothetical protein
MNIAGLLFAKVRSSDSIFQDIVGEDTKELTSILLDKQYMVLLNHLLNAQTNLVRIWRF